MFQVEPERYLSCPICQGIVEDPVTLQCNHTYCRQCIADFIKSRGDARRNKIIPCALKCEGTKVPDPSKPSEDWAKQLKPSFIISNLVDDYLRTASCQCARCSRNDTLKWCQMCGHSLCETCISSHRRDPTTRLHTITDLPQRSEKPSQPFPQCEDHQDEIVRLICEDHNKAICNTCCSLHHRQCRSVVLMDSRGSQIMEHVTDEKSKLEGKIEEVLTLMTTKRSKYDLLVSKQTEQQKRIRDTFKKLIDYLKEKKAMLLRELDDVIEKEIDMIQDDIKLEENRLQLHQQRVHFIEQAVRSGSVFDMYRMCQSLLTGGVSETDNIKHPGPVLKHVEYHVNTDELMKQLKRLDLGIIRVEHESDSKPRLKEFILSETIENKCSADEEEPSIDDITVLEVRGIHTIVVTDYRNKCVKSFYTRNNKPYYSRLALKGVPWGITQLKNKVMVAVPRYISQIVTVSVTPDLKLLSFINTSKMYYSLAVLGDTSLAAGGSGCVDILNMEGEVMKSICIHSTNVFSSTWYMCVSNTGHLLVSDLYKKRVICLTREGEVVWTYTGTGEGELRYPKGITTTDRGDILVVDYELKKVIQLSETGEYVGDVVSSHLRYPGGICVDKHGSMFVGDQDVIKRYSTV